MKMIMMKMIRTIVGEGTQRGREAEWQRGRELHA